VDVDKIKTIRQTGDGNVIKKAGDDETSRHRHVDETIE